MELNIPSDLKAQFPLIRISRATPGGTIAIVHEAPSKVSWREILSVAAKIVIANPHLMYARPMRAYFEVGGEAKVGFLNLYDAGVRKLSGKPY